MAVRMTVLLDEDIDARFSAFCQDRGFKKSTLAARLIREHLEREGKPAETMRRVGTRRYSTRLVKGDSK